MPAVRFVAVGDVLVDVFAAGSGHEADVRLVPGGSAYNSAVAAASTGADVELVARIGDDAAGRMVRAEVEARGVRASLTVDDGLPTGTFLVVDGVTRVDRGANAGFGPEHLPAAVDADAALVSGHLPEATVAAALRASRAPWTALAAARLSTLPEGGNAVFVNESEARALTGLEGDEALDALGFRYRLVCVTRGARGAIAALDGAVESAIADVRAQEADQPGAGDAFASTVLVELAAGTPFREALAAGCRAGARSLAG